MALKLRPSGIGSGIDKDRPDYTVVTGEWEVGRIYESRGGPDNLRWFWSMTVNGPMTRSDCVPTLEEARPSCRSAGTIGRLGRNLKRCRSVGCGGTERLSASCARGGRSPISPVTCDRFL